MNCEDVHAVLSDYFEETLAEDICREVRAHLDQCRDCRIYVDTTQKTIVLYRAREAASVPSEVHHRLFDALDLGDIVATIPFPRPKDEDSDPLS